jgi:pimeloyl-ACP methyl ester carboxylesterase
VSSESSSSAAPAWFTQALNAPCESRFADVEGTLIHYLSWNAADTQKPALLFAHGFRAHARWWSFIAPFFVNRYRVVALDFSAMGDSGHRRQYEDGIFARDIVGVMDDANLGTATLVGHSFGGSRVVETCANYPQLVERAVVIDSYIPIPEIELREAPQLKLRPKRVYPTYAAARERFRLVPEHNCAAPYVLDYVGRHSLREVEGGWTWKFDDAFIPHYEDRTADAALAVAQLSSIKMPVALVYGDLSIILTESHAHALMQHLQHGHGPIAIPQAHHHVMLDQPLALVAALKGILY